MLHKCTFANEEAGYPKEVFPYVVDAILCNYPEATITIYYDHTMRVTRSYEIAMYKVKHSAVYIKYLIIDTAEVTFYVSDNLAKVVTGDASIQKVICSNMAIPCYNAGDYLEACGISVRDALTAAAEILDGARVYYDNCHELSYLPTSCLPTLDLEPEHIYEVYVEGTFRGLPVYVGLPIDGGLCISARNENLEMQVADLIKKRKEVS